jgi:hypothetical protein
LLSLTLVSEPFLNPVPTPFPKPQTSGADLRPLARALRKPLRPLWISQRTVIWLNEVADVSALPFTPVICLSASEPSVTPRQATGEGSGWAYVPGAGDDEESWARVSNLSRTPSRLNYMLSCLLQKPVLKFLSECFEGLRGGLGVLMLSTFWYKLAVTQEICGGPRCLGLGEKKRGGHR